MSRLLVLSPEPVRARMAGMGIRACEIARHVSAAGHAVTVVAPGDPAEAPSWLREAGVAVEGLEGARLGAVAARHDGAIVSGHVASELFRHAAPLPTLVDLYDPFLVENLAYASRLGPGIFRHDLETLSLQLERGDRFLVSSPVQRAFYAGLLLANGRIDPDVWAADPSLERLLSVAPFGVPSEPPAPGPALLRAPGTGIGERDPVLFFGGVYDWYDPEALLSVFDGVLRRVPACRLVFVSSPNPGTTPQGAYARALETARGRGWLGRNVLFVPWFPYESRGAVYLEATAAVLTHRSSLETDLSLRTRGLDFLWAGLPVVSHRGGGIGQLIAETGAGLVVDAEDAAGLVDALARVLTDAVLREELAGRGRAAVEAFRWEKTLAPVLEFAAAPAFDPLRRSRAKAPARRGGGVRRKISEILARRRRP